MPLISSCAAVGWGGCRWQGVGWARGWVEGRGMSLTVCGVGEWVGGGGCRWQCVGWVNGWVERGGGALAVGGVGGWVGGVG